MSEACCLTVACRRAACIKQIDHMRWARGLGRGGKQRPSLQHERQGFGEVKGTGVLLWPKPRHSAQALPAGLWSAHAPRSASTRRACRRRSRAAGPGAAPSQRGRRQTGGEAGRAAQVRRAKPAETTQLPSTFNRPWRCRRTCLPAPPGPASASAAALPCHAATTAPPRPQSHPHHRSQ